MLGLCSKLECSPSTIFDIEDPYTAYCFNEACIYILRRIENGDEPMFEKHYKSFSDLYAQYN